MSVSAYFRSGFHPPQITSIIVSRSLQIKSQVEINEKILYRLNEKYKNKTIAKRWPDTETEVGLNFRSIFQNRKVFLNPSVVNAEELVCTGSLVNIVGFALCLLFVHKGINRTINWRALYETIHDLKESFS